MEGSGIWVDRLGRAHGNDGGGRRRGGEGEKGGP